MFELRGRSLLVGQRPSVFFDCAAVPHEAFTAACAAATDQNTSAKRKKEAPMLDLLIHKSSDADIDLRVAMMIEEEEEEEEKGQAKKNHNDRNNNNTPLLQTSPSPHHYSQQIDRLKKVIKTLEEGKAAEAVSFKRENAKLRRKIETMESERRVWNITRNEIQENLSRLSQQLAQCKRERSSLQAQIQETQQDAREFRGQVKFLELQMSNYEDGVDNNDDDNNDNGNDGKPRGDSQRRFESKASRDGDHDDVTSLRNQLDALTKENQDMKNSLEKELNDAKSSLTTTQHENKELRFKLRMLEGQMRHLQQELQNQKESEQGSSSSTTTSGGTRRRRTTPTKTRFYNNSSANNISSEIMEFKHPDSMMNQQLDILRDRYKKMQTLLLGNPNNAKNLEILGKLEKAILEIARRS